MSYLPVSIRDLTHGLTLIFQVKHRYRIAPTPTYSDRGRHPPMLLLEGRQKGSMKFDIDDTNMPSQSEIDYELEKLRSMSAEEAAICCSVQV